jgi:hypothetical protein
MGMGPPPDPFTGELRNQLRDLQRQIEELRQQLQAMTGPIERDPYGRPKPEPPKPDNPPRR